MTSYQELTTLAPDTNVTRLRTDWLGIDIVDLGAPDTQSWRDLCAHHRHEPSFVCRAAETGPQADWWETAEPTRQRVKRIFDIETGAVIEGRRLEGGLLMVTGWVGIWREQMDTDQLAHLADLRLPGVRLVEPNGRSSGSPLVPGMRFTAPPPAALPPRQPAPDDRATCMPTPAAGTALAALWRSGL